MKRFFAILFKSLAALHFMIAGACSTLFAQEGPGGVGTYGTNNMLMWYDFADGNKVQVGTGSALDKIYNKANSNQYIDNVAPNPNDATYSLFQGGNNERGLFVQSGAMLSEVVSNGVGVNRSSFRTGGEYIIAFTVNRGQSAAQQQNNRMPLFGMSDSPSGYNIVMTGVTANYNFENLVKLNWYNNVNQVSDLGDYNSSTSRSNIHSFVFSQNLSSTNANIRLATGAIEGSNPFQHTYFFSSNMDTYHLRAHATNTGGYIHEIIAFQQTLSDVKRKIVFNALAGKWSLPLDNRIYSQPVGASFYYDIVGVGTEGGESHLLSASSKLSMAMSYPASGSNYAFIGHNNGTEAINQQVPGPVPQLKRSDRIWWYNKSGAPGSLRFSIPKNVMEAGLSNGLNGRIPMLIISQDATLSTDHSTTKTRNLSFDANNQAYYVEVPETELNDGSYISYGILDGGSCSAIGFTYNTAIMARNISGFQPSIGLGSGSNLYVDIENPELIGSTPFSFSIAANTDQSLVFANAGATYSPCEHIFQSTIPNDNLDPAMWCVDRGQLSTGDANLRFSVSFRNEDITGAGATSVLMVDESGLGIFTNAKVYAMAFDEGTGRWVAKNVAIPKVARLSIGTDVLRFQSSSPQDFDLSTSLLNSGYTCDAKLSAYTNADYNTYHLRRYWKYTGSANTSVQVTAGMLQFLNLAPANTYQHPAILVSSDPTFATDVKVYVMNTQNQATLALSPNSYFTIGYLQEYQESASYGEVVGTLGKAFSGYEKKSIQNDVYPELGLSTFSDPDVGDYLMLRNDYGSLPFTLLGTLSGVNYAASQRNWLLSEYGNLGNLNVFIDPSEFGAMPSWNDSYGLLVDLDGTGTNKKLYGMVKQGPKFWANNVPMQNGTVFTVVTYKKETLFLEERNKTLTGPELTSTSSITLNLRDKYNVDFASACQDRTEENTVLVKFNTGDIHCFGTQSNVNATLSVSVQLISVVDGNEVITPVVITSSPMPIDYTSPEKVFRYTFAGHYDRIRINVVPPYTTSNNSAALAANIRLSAEIISERKMQVPQLNGSSLITDQAFSGGHAAPDDVNTPTYSFAWHTDQCPVSNYQFQLLRLYPNTTTSAPFPSNERDITTTVDWTKALTLDLPTNGISLTLAEGTGYYAWRVRPIGNFYEGNEADSRNWGNWSTDNISLAETLDLDEGDESEYDNSLFFYQQFNSDKNFIYNRAFTEKGRVHEGLTIANTLQQPVQSQTKLATFQGGTWGNVLTTQTLYDVNARPFVTTLPAPDDAPLTSTVLGFRYGFMQYDLNGLPLIKYDIDKPIPVGSTVEPEAELVVAGSLGRYYSATNTSDYIPESDGYPYVRSKYSTDGNNQVIEQSGVGATFKLGSGHTITTQFGNPSQDELLEMFGDEAPVSSAVQKTAVKDQNGVVTYSFTDNQGRTIATAMIPSNPQGTTNPNMLNLDATDDGSANIRTISDEIKENLPWGETGRRAVGEYVISQETDLKIKYEIEKPVFEAMCTYLEKCATCGYSVMINVINLDNGKVVDFFSPGSFTSSLGAATGENNSCANSTLQSTSEHTTHLQPGRYRVEKIATLSNTGEEELLAKVKEKASQAFDKVKNFFALQTEISGINIRASMILHDPSSIQPEGGSPVLTPSLVDESGQPLANALQINWRDYKDGYKLKITSECCTIEIPVHTYDKDPCKEGLDDPELTKPLLEDFVEDFAVEHLKKKNEADPDYLSRYSDYSMADLKSLITNMYDEQVDFATQSSDFKQQFEVYNTYTCDNLVKYWKSAVLAMAPKTFPSGVNQPADKAGTIETPVGDVDRSNPFDEDEKPTFKLEDYLLKSAGVAYGGFITSSDADPILKTKAYQVFYYDKAATKVIDPVSGTIYYPCQDAFCNTEMRDVRYDPQTGSLVNVSGYPVGLPSVYSIDNYCNSYRNPCTISQSAGGFFGYQVLTAASYALKASDYKAVKECAIAMKSVSVITGQTASASGADFSQIAKNADIRKQALELTTKCQTACDAKRDFFLSELQALYADNTMNYANQILGSELQVNGEFNDNSSGWQKWEGGVLSPFTATNPIPLSNGKLDLMQAPNDMVVSAYSLTVGSKYRIFFETANTTSGQILTLKRNTASSGANYTSWTAETNKSYFFEFIATSPTLAFYAYNYINPYVQQSLELDNIYLREVTLESTPTPLTPSDLCCMADALVDQCKKDCQVGTVGTNCPQYGIVGQLNVKFSIRYAKKGAWTAIPVSSVPSSTSTGYHLTITSSEASTMTVAKTMETQALAAGAYAEIKAELFYGGWRDVCITKYNGFLPSTYQLGLHPTSGMVVKPVGGNALTPINSECSSDVILAPLIRPRSREILFSAGSEEQIKTVRAIMGGAISLQRSDPTEAECAAGYNKLVPWDLEQYTVGENCNYSDPNEGPTKQWDVAITNFANRKSGNAHIFDEGTHLSVIYGQELSPGNFAVVFQKINKDGTVNSEPKRYGADSETKDIIKIEDGSTIYHMNLALQNIVRNENSYTLLVSNMYDNDYYIDSYLQYGYMSEGSWLITLDLDGQIINQKKYNHGVIDSPFKIFPKNNGNGYLIVGAKYAVNLTLFCELFVVEIDNQGNLQFQGNQVKGFNKSFPDFQTIAISKAYDNDGYILLVDRPINTINTIQNCSDANLKSSHGNHDAYAIKIDNSYNIIWEQAYGGNLKDFPYSTKTNKSIISELDGNVSIIGGGSTSKGSTGDQNFGLEFPSITQPSDLGDYVFLKTSRLDSEFGKVLTAKSYGGNFEDAPRIIAKYKDGYIIGGNSTGLSGQGSGKDVTEISRGQEDVWLLLLDKDGNKLNGKNDFLLGTDGSDNISDVIVDGENIFIALTSKDFTNNGDFSSSGTGETIRIVKLGKNPPSCRPQDLCYKWVTAEEKMPVLTNVQNLDPVSPDIIAANNTKNSISTQLDQCQFGKADEVKKAYRAKCVGNTFEDKTTVSYDIKQGHYTLYYYNRGGQLVRTVPPAGVELKTITNNVRERSLPDAATAHRLITHYQYNSLGQLISQSTPDGDGTNANVSSFHYNRFGQLRFSQSARQAGLTPARYSYTKYDYLGRTVETGEAVLPTGLDFAQLNSTAYLGDDPDAVSPTVGAAQFPTEPSSIIERAVTVYTESAGQVGFRYGSQEHLQNRVSYSYVENVAEGRKAATYYSYDPHGNVAWLVQEIPGFSTYHIAYEYDLISNKVTKVSYNEGQADQFFHRYDYDADNRITAAYTSSDGVIWDKDASYGYYKHGPLRRTELGEDRVQGLDYMYTLQGWLKNINHPAGRSYDPGRDVTSAFSGVAEDAYGLQLDYFSNDFKCYDWDRFDPVASLTTAFNSLYNGNIAVWQNRINQTLADDPATNVSTSAQVFKYDMLNRIRQSDYLKYTTPGPALYTPDQDKYKTTYTYDGNGNLMTLNRNGHVPASLAMDQLSYTYPVNSNGKITSNVLKSVSDAIPNESTNYTEDIYGTTNYVYDGSGNLTRDDKEQVTIKWNVFGKVAEVVPDQGTSKPWIRYFYDASGNRILKEVISSPYNGQNLERKPENITTTAYVRDASGNTMAIYNRKNVVSPARLATYSLEEQTMYGSSRLGLRLPGSLSIAQVKFNEGEEDKLDYWYDNRPKRLTEFANWLLPERRASIYTTSTGSAQYGTFVWRSSTYSALASSFSVSTLSVGNGISGLSGKSTFSAEDDEGNLKFYGQVAKNYWGGSNVTLLYDNWNILMPNSTGLKGHHQFQSVVVQYPGSSSKYILVTGDKEMVNGVEQSKLYYHIIDMNATGNGRGNVVSMNNAFPKEHHAYLKMGTQMASAEDRANKKSFVYVQGFYNGTNGLANTLLTYEFKLSNTGNLIIKEYDSGFDLGTMDNGNGQGAIRLSPDGTKILVSSPQKNAGWFDVQHGQLFVIELGNNFIPVYNALTSQQTFDLQMPSMAGSPIDFDKDSRYVMAQANGLGYNDVALSPDGTEQTLWKFDLRDHTQELQNTFYESPVQRAKDGKIYAATYRTQATSSTSPQSIGSTPRMDAFDGDGYTYDLQYGVGMTLGMGTLPVQTHRLFGSPSPNGTLYARVLGKKHYEITDHLGNVTAVIGDQYRFKSGTKSPMLLNYYNYYPFGAPLPGVDKKREVSETYRYKYNGKEQDQDFLNNYDYGFRIYNPNIAKFLSVDPLTKSYPELTPYQFASNAPIGAVDVDGLESSVQYNYNGKGDLVPSYTPIRESTEKGEIVQKGKDNYINNSFYNFSFISPSSQKSPSAMQAEYELFDSQQPATAGGFEKVPLLGPLFIQPYAQAVKDYHYGDLMNASMNFSYVVSNLFLARSLTIGIAGGGLQAMTLGNRAWFVKGSRDTYRTFYGMSGYLPKGTVGHHALIYQNGPIGKYVPNFIKNQIFNIKPFNSQGLHMSLAHGENYLGFKGASSIENLWYGTPQWLKTSSFSTVNRQIYNYNKE